MNSDDRFQICTRSKTAADKFAIKVKQTTKHLLEDDLIEIVLECWEKLGNNEIEGVKIFQMMDMQCVGGALEKLISKCIEERCTNSNFQWKGCSNNKKDKDVVCVNRGEFSIEIKTGSSKGLRVFGNRSYAKVSENAIKSRESYVLTINVDLDSWTVCLIRLGKLSPSDWLGQKSATGQQARISKNAYQTKLKILKGEYQMDVPIRYISGIGEKTAERLNKNNIFTVSDLLDYNCKERKFAQLFLDVDYL